MGKLQIELFVCNADNFGVLLHDPETGLTASIDSPDSDTINRQLKNRGWQLSHIFNTHHHHDHTAGNEHLKRSTGCTIIGAASDARRLPALDVPLEDGEIFAFGNIGVKMLATPGHTLGSVCWLIETEKLLFTGDTLFSMGCGRLFEGTPEIMWQSLLKIRALPDDILVYCGHEYSLTNAEFALELDMDNKALHDRASEVRNLRRAHSPTLPVTLATEKATNPFLRADRAELGERLGMSRRPPVEIFAEIRSRRNNF